MAKDFLVKKLFSFITELPDNFNLEMLCFAGQRVSGVLLAMYLIAHIFIISTATIFGPQTFSDIMVKMHHPVLVFLEMLLFPADDVVRQRFKRPAIARQSRQFGPGLADEGRGHPA